MAGGRQILAQVILSLRDGLSGPAKQAAGALKGVEKGINDLKRTADQAGNIGLNLNRNLSNLRPTAQAVDQIRVNYQRLGEEMKRTAQGAVAIEQSTRRLSNATTAELSKARSSVLNLAAAYGVLRRATSFTVGSGLRAAGVAGGVYGGAIVARNTIQAGAQRMRQTERERNAGLTTEELANLNVTTRQIGQAFPSINDIRMREIGQVATTTAPNLAAASSMMDTLARFYVKMQTLRGLQGADRGLEDMIKAMDTMQRVEDPRQFRNLVDLLTRAMGVEGGQQLNPGEIFNFAKRARTAGMALNDDFLGTILPTMIQQGSGDNAGTAMMTLLMQATGLRQRRELSSQLIRDGLMTPVQATETDSRGRVRRGWRGRFVDGDLMRQNPYEWTHKHIAPMIRQQLGMQPGQEFRVDQASKVLDFLGQRFGDRNVLGPIADWIISQNQFERGQRRIRSNEQGSINTAESARERDPYIAFASVMQRMSSAAAEFAIPLITQVMPAMNSFADTLSGLANYFRDNTTGIQTFGSSVGRVFSAIFDIGGSLADLASPLVSVVVPGLNMLASALELVGDALRGIRWFLDAYSKMQPLRDADPLQTHNFGREQRREAEQRRRASLNDLMGRAGLEQLQNDERLLSNRVRQRDADAAAWRPGSAVGSSRAAYNEAEIRRLTDVVITSAANAGHGAGGSLGSGIAAGIDQAGPMAVQSAQRIMEQIRQTFGAGVNVPINLQPSGGGGGGAAAAPPPARALGGPVTAGRLYMVGEEGPEPFVPGANGSIIPNHAMGSLGGRSVRMAVNIGGIHVANGDPQAIADQIADRVKSALRGAFSDTEMSWG